jgi:hypothetical protein
VKNRVSCRKVQGADPIAGPRAHGFPTAIVFGNLVRGRFPESYYELLNAEGVALLEEDVRIAISYGRTRRRLAMRGAIAITERRLAIWGTRGKQIDVPFADPKYAQLEIAADLDDGLLIAFDASALDETQSGRVEMRLRVTDAERVAQTLR